MTIDPKYFDRIRVKPQGVRETKGPRCELPGCTRTGTHRAPMGRGREGQYLVFCVDHVREYNKSYNYFDGMDDKDVARWQKDTITGHRPTWKFGINGASTAPGTGGAARARRGQTAYPFGMFDQNGASPRHQTRTVSNAARKALDTLGLDAGVTKAEIKARYKALVKRHHPDANGGTRDAEDRLAEVIKAYRYLRSAGFC